MRQYFYTALTPKPFADLLRAACVLDQRHRETFSFSSKGEEPNFSFLPARNLDVDAAFVFSKDDFKGPTNGHKFMKHDTY